VILLSTRGGNDLSGHGNGKAQGIVTRIPVLNGGKSSNDERDPERRKSISVTDVVGDVMKRIASYKSKKKKWKESKESKESKEEEKGGDSETKGGGGDDVLPQGWEIATDEDGDVYYYNEESGVTQWDPPTMVAKKLSVNPQSRAKSLWKKASKSARRRKSVALSQELLNETVRASRSDSMGSIGEAGEEEEEEEEEGDGGGGGGGGGEQKGEKKEKDDHATYDVSSLRLTLLNALYAPAGSYLQSVANCFSRLDSFAHLLIWTTDRVSHDDQLVKPDFIELPRLGLTFRRQQDDKLHCDQHAGFFVSEQLASDPRLKKLARGMPNSLLLESKTGELQLIVSALASPFRTEEGSTTTDGNPKTTLQFPYGAIYEYHDRGWVERAKHVGHYVLPVHMSRQFLFTPTLGAALYLLMVRFFQRDYQAVCSLAPSVVSDSKLDDNESQLLEHLEYLASDTHPDAHACRVKLSLSLMGNEEYMQCPWEFEEELRAYVDVFHHVSSCCRLTPTEECRLTEMLTTKMGDDKFGLRYVDVRAEVLRRCSATYRRIGRGGQDSVQAVQDVDVVSVPIQSPFKFSRSIGTTDLIFDKMNDMSIFSSDSLSKLSKLSYTRPTYNKEEEKDPQGTSFSFLSKVTQGGMSLKGGKHSLGFLFLYELFTKSEELPEKYGCVADGDKQEVLASLLLRLMPSKDTQTKGVLMSILRHLEGGLNVRKPSTLSVDEDRAVMELREAMPPWTEAKGLFSKFGGSSHFSKFIASVATVVRKCLVKEKASSSHGEEDYVREDLALPTQIEIHVSLQRLWPEVTVDDTNRKSRTFHPVTIDGSVGYSSGSVTSSPLVLDEETTIRLATQPLCGTGMLDSRYITLTLPSESGGGEATGATRATTTPFDVSGARMHPWAKHTSAQRMLDRLEEDCDIYTKMLESKKTGYVTGLTTTSECESVSKSGAALEKVRLTVSSLKQDLLRQKQLDYDASNQMVDALLRLTSIESIGTDVERSSDDNEKRETVRCALRLERYVDSCTAGSVPGGPRQQVGIMFEDLVRLLVSTRGDASLRRKNPFWTKENVESIEILIVFTVLLMSRISQISRIITSVSSLSSDLETLR